MHNICTYHIEVQGKVDEMALNAASPITVYVDQTNEGTAQFTIRADQSGCVGLIRHLHQQGFVLLAMSRECSQMVQE